jgi:hypothetical protein
MYNDIPEIIEATGGKYCTALSLIKVAWSQVGVLYDYQTLWNATPKQYDQYGQVIGAIPLDTIKTAINQGLLNTQTGQYDKLWDNWMDGNSGQGVQYNMSVTQSACMIDGYFYSDWLNYPANSVLSIPQTPPITDHSYIVKDWDADGNAIVDMHLGYDLKMPLSVLTSEINGMGCSAYIPTNKIINERREISILQTILELYQKIILLLCA